MLGYVGSICSFMSVHTPEVVGAVLSLSVLSAYVPSVRCGVWVPNLDTYPLFSSWCIAVLCVSWRNQKRKAHGLDNGAKIEPRLAACRFSEASFKAEIKLDLISCLYSKGS